MADNDVFCYPYYVDDDYLPQEQCLTQHQRSEMLSSDSVSSFNHCILLFENHSHRISPKIQLSINA